MGESKDIQLAYIVHCDDEIELLPRFQKLQRLDGCLYAENSRRVTQVEFQIVRRDQRLYMSVFLQRIAVVVVADKQDPSDPSLH